MIQNPMNHSQKLVQTDKLPVSALLYLEKFYQEFTDESFYFGYQFIRGMVQDGDRIARTLGLTDMEYANALTIICFRFAGVTDFLEEEGSQYKLLHDFAMQINYPVDDLIIVESSIARNISGSIPGNNVEIVAWDAISSAFALDDFIVQLSFLKEEMNRINSRQYTESELLIAFKDKFTHTIYYSEDAKRRFGEKKERNLIKLIKRIQKLQSAELRMSKENNRIPAITLSNKETEDLFKIAFRNYVHLVSVADSKAGLLINVNSIIISVVIAFVVGRSEKYPFLLMPSFVLLGVSFLTIMLSILASRPQKNRLIQDKTSNSYQTFFFGSFDLIEKSFLKADWSHFSVELDELLKGGKENVYNEMYKETYNVRKVLGRKFTYLSAAYWVFLAGLFISIVTFFVGTYHP